MRTISTSTMTIILFLAAATVSVARTAQRNSDSLQPPEVKLVVSTDKLQDALASVISAPVVIPRGPNDVLQDYEAQMELVCRRYASELAAISQAAQNGHLSREQAEEYINERYQVAMMQFQLLSALHETTQNEIERTPMTQPVVKSQPNTGAATVALPFSSLQLNPWIIQYLQLTQDQVTAIEQVMSKARPEVEPLKAELHSLNRRLLVLNQKQLTDGDENEIQTLAASQATALTKLITANARMGGKIYQILSPKQRTKLDRWMQANDLVGSDN